METTKVAESKEEEGFLVQFHWPDDAPTSYRQFQDTVNARGAPSQQIIQRHIEHAGKDYRLETLGEHPVERFRERRVTVL